DNLYNKDSVILIAQSNTEKNVEADKLFLSGIDAYRNRKNAAEGLNLFRESILKKPQAKAYYELGNTLFDLKKMPEALRAYEMAELLDYQPLHKVLYHMACAYAVLDNRDSAKYYLISAIEF